MPRSLLPYRQHRNARRCFSLVAFALDNATSSCCVIAPLLFGVDKVLNGLLIIITFVAMELLRVSCLFALVLLASGLEFPSQDSESVSLDVQQITHEPLVNGQSMPRREWTSARPGARPMSPPPRVRSYQQRLGEASSSTCQPCEEMGELAFQCADQD